MWLKSLPFLLSLLISFIPQSAVNKPQEFSIPPVSLEKIFSRDHSWTSTVSAQRKITITAVGDIMPGRTITAYHNGGDFSYLYDSVRIRLTGSDLTVGNLESPVTSECKPFIDGMRFCIPPPHLLALKSAGFGALSLANNHIYDYGQSGFDSTLQAVSSVGIVALPPNTPEFIKVKNHNVALIGFNFIPAMKNITPTNEQITTVISSATKVAELVIVFPHWGIEYTFLPSKQQISLAHLMVDSGADLVLGSHPHWIQPVEIYHDKLIVYSHGNFVFDQYWSENTRRGLIGNYTFIDRRLIDASFLPVHISSDGHPELMSEPTFTAILDNMKSSSRQE